MKRPTVRKDSDMLLLAISIYHCFFALSIRNLMFMSFERRKCEKVNFRDRRLQLGLTQGDIAEKLNVSQTAVSHWEKGDVSPCRKYHAQLAEILEVPLAEVKEFATRKRRYI